MKGENDVLQIAGAALGAMALAVWHQITYGAKQARLSIECVTTMALLTTRRRRLLALVWLAAALCLAAAGGCHSRRLPAAAGILPTPPPPPDAPPCDSETGFSAADLPPLPAAPPADVPDRRLLRPGPGLAVGFTNSQSHQPLY
ncbi:hypothetical protein ACP4OV_009281 [Aristida adscensionis]